MRTREEQIAELRDLIDAPNEVPDETDSIQQATDHILEAERRAEERVRAEIGQDSERLDWLCWNIGGREALKLVGIIHDTGDLDEWRKAIDAAREAG